MNGVTEQPLLKVHQNVQINYEAKILLQQKCHNLESTTDYDIKVPASSSSMLTGVLGLIIDLIYIKL